MAKAPLRKLRDELVRVHPDVGDPEAAIREGRILVDGVVMTNPESRVRRGTAIACRRDEPLRGLVKLRPALRRFAVDAKGRVALDAGAAAGGFTQALLEAGARKVYAVEVGYGQLLGSLHQDPRVVSLERTNISELDSELIPDPIEIVTLDLSYLSLAEGVPQLNELKFGDDADLVALVKPMFELRLPEAPDDRASLDRALALAVAGAEAAGWDVVATMDSEMQGSRGARELFLHGRRRG
jgi:23S rRNA (cytidine1920-2'-O)/16S rRNA (cytidine1409-2'-O)-methyltransferase